MNRSRRAWPQYCLDKYMVTRVILLLAGLGGCGQSLEAGLANAPSARRASQPRREHDVIGNGPESCGKDQPSEKYREPPCAELHDVGKGGGAAAEPDPSGANRNSKKSP